MVAGEGHVAPLCSFLPCGSCGTRGLGAMLRGGEQGTCFLCVPVSHTGLAEPGAHDGACPYNIGVKCWGETGRDTVSL